jgi:hypothetical protein
MSVIRLTPKLHALKIWPCYFREVLSGQKTFEIREMSDDRNFQVGDTLWLQEWDPDQKAYSGKHTVQKVTYILKGPAFGIADGFAVMSIKPHVETAIRGV